MMFVFYRLFHRCVGSTPSHGDYPSNSTSPSASSVPSSDPGKNPALLFWLAAFGLNLWFRLAAELVIRTLFFTTCALLIGTLDGSLNLVVGHAVLRAARHDGYDPPLPSSIEAGSLGGLVVIGPTTLATVPLIALLGGIKIQRAFSRHVAVLLELASATAVSAAAASVGVAIVRCRHPDDRSPLDTLHAARAGALGACLLTVPIIVSTAAVLFMREPQTTPSAQTRTEPDTPPASTLADGLGRPVTHDAPSPRTRSRPHVIAHTAAETVGYVLVTLCILSIRLLCF